MKTKNKTRRCVKILSSGCTMHFVHLDARKGKAQARGSSGFPSLLRFNRLVMSPPQDVGETFSELVEGSESQDLSLTLQSIVKKGPYDADTYRLVIPEVVRMTIYMRVANSLLHIEDEAYAQFNLHLEDVQAMMPVVHSVSGQTFC